MVDLHEITLFYFNQDQEAVLYELWNKVLKNHDEWWHFFYEGEETLIRVEAKSLKLVEKLIKKKGLGYSYNGIWVDNIGTTRKFQEEFLYIFHGYSELAMKNYGTGNKEVFWLLDRVTHCFMNNMTSNDRSNEGELYGWWEPMMVCKTAIARAYTVGQIIGRNKNDKKGKQGEEGKAPQEDGS